MTTTTVPQRNARIAEHLEIVGTMHWLPPFRTQRGARKIVMQFLRKLQDDAARQGNSVGVRPGASASFRL